jgi:tetratricopeptide (TPR) repeat protein
MSESDGKQGGNRVWHRRILVLRRGDHIGDPLGMIFLDDPESVSDPLVEKLREYLGPRVRLLKAEITHDAITVEVESHGWREESNRLANAADDLHKKGARRNALEMYREALVIDPLNGEAMLGLGMALARSDKFSEALTALRRAREFFGKDEVDVLLAMARCAARLQRTATAIDYLETAYDVDPRNFMVRRALRALGREPARTLPASPAASKTGDS